MTASFISRYSWIRRRTWILLFCLTACGGDIQRDDGHRHGSPQPGEPTRLERSAVTTRIEYSGGATGPPPAAPGFRLGDAIEVGPDGKPVPPKK